MKNNTQEIIFRDHIEQHARAYFPELTADSVTVKLRTKQERPFAVLYRYDVKAETQSYSIIVKVPVRDLPRDTVKKSDYEKPLLFQQANSQEMHLLQYTALTFIYQYFSQLNDENLGAIHVLDYLPEYHAVVMEESFDPRLQKLFLNENRFQSRFTDQDLNSAFRNAGKWLQKYHTMPKEQGVQFRHQTRGDYIEGIVTLTDFLANAWGDEAFFKHIASNIVRKCEEILPESLPLGLGHGDYALRNILVGRNARVTVLDTFSKWRVPIYEDIGYFLNNFKTTYPQVASQGLLYSSNQMYSYEHAFLTGYFGTGYIPYLNIRLYEMLALLDKWSSLMNHYHKRSGRFRYFGGAKTLLASRYFKNQAASYLNLLMGAEKGNAFSAMEKSFE